MGEVYRAHDTVLGRDVAIKILPELFAADPERIARFEREAKTLASLNHPNIGGIYGLEHADPSAGSGQAAVRALVLELVEGPTLAEKLAELSSVKSQVSGLSLDEALSIARQIVEALEAAHEQGIVHRDLKPANIKVRPDGTVKVLDFGLAKAMDPIGSAPNLSRSPTITSPLMMTGVGTILGTAAYMAPEQARGKAVDKRADIWALGCVLYEMLTGQRAFGGDDVSVTLARILEREPDLDALPSSVPARVRQALGACLRKDPKERVRDIGDVRLALEGAFETAVPQTGAPASAPQRRRVGVVGAAAAIASGVIVGTGVWAATRPAEPVPPRVSRLQITPAGSAALTISGADRDLAITPDGSRLVYVGNNGTQLFVRALDVLEPVAVFSGSPRGPFVSPDGQWIGFQDGYTGLKKVSMAGGPAVTLATLDGVLQGATWGPDDTIIFATSISATGLHQVGAAGGPTTVLTRPDRAQGEVDHLWPEWLPGGRAVLFTMTALTGGLDAAQVAVLDLQTGKHRVLVPGGSHAYYVASGLGSLKRAEREGGHLVYGAAGTLRAVAFDLAGLETRGTPVPVVPAVMTTGRGAVDAVVAGDGTLAYASGGRVGGLKAPRTLMWVDRGGRESPIPAPPRAYMTPRLSPDGARVAVYAVDQDYDLWIWDLGRTTLTRATFDPGLDPFPVWTPDGRRLIFTSDRAGQLNLFWQAADGTGAVERLTESPNIQQAGAVSPDGRTLIFTEIAPKTGADLMQMALDGTRLVTPLVQSPFAEQNGVVSPDGRWLAYEANDSGPFEISVRPFPAVNSGHWQVTTGGGIRPLWARNSQELFYISSTGALMRVGMARGASWQATQPTLVVKEGYFGNARFFPTRSYDIAPDGQRFLLIKEGDGSDQNAAPASLIVVQHWTEELKRLVPNR
jgi:serine/threonine-protein kinase